MALRTPCSERSATCRPPGGGTRRGRAPWSRSTWDEPSRESRRGPDQAHDRHVARDDDLLDVERIDQRLRPVAKRTMQRAAHGIVVAFRRSAKIVAQVRREEVADARRIAGVEVIGPLRQSIANGLLGHRVRHRGRSRQRPAARHQDRERAPFHRENSTTVRSSGRTRDRTWCGDTGVSVSGEPVASALSKSAVPALSMATSLNESKT